MQVDPIETVPPTQRKPRFFYGWYIVLASVLTNAYLSTAFFQGFAVFFLPILNEFGWTRAQTSIAFSLRQLEIGVLAPLMGFLVDWLGGRKVIIGSMIISGLGLVLMSRINSLWSFYATFALISIGVSGAGHGISWAAVVAAWFARQRGRAMGFAFLGPVVGAPAIILVVLLEEAVGWRSSILMLGVGIWVIGIPLGMIARSRPQDYGYLPDGDIPDESSRPEDAASDDAEDGQPAVPPRAPGLTAGEALRSRSFWILVALFGLPGMGLSGLFVHQIPFFENAGFSTAQAAFTVSVMFFVSGLGRMSVGVLMDMLDWRLIMGGVLSIQIVAFLFLVNLTEYWQAVAFSAIMGIGFGATIPARPILVGMFFGMRAYGSIQGLLQGSAIGSGVAGPIVMGWVFDTYGTYTPAILGFTAISALALPVLLMAGNPKKEKADVETSDTATV